MFAAVRDRPGHQQSTDALTEMGAALVRGDQMTAARVFLGYWGDEAFDSLPMAARRRLAAQMPLVEAGSAGINEDSGGIMGRLARIACPVLLVEGATSPAVIAEIQGVLAQGLPQAARRAIVGAGHMAPLTHPRQVAQVIDDWLALGAQDTN